ncbi:MAG: hypothetical protein RLZZ272_1340, partial [Actinomycetota bacterium]
MTTPTRALAVVVWLAIAMVGVATPPPASAVAGQDDALAAVADDGPVRLHVRRIPLRVGPAVGVDTIRMRIVLEHVGDVPLGPTELTIALHPAVDGRAALLTALVDGPATRAIRLRRAPVRALAPGDLVSVELELPLGGLGLAGEDAEGDGSSVHPVTLRLSDGREELARLDSAIVRLTGQPAAPLLASVVVPFSDAPWRTVGDAYPVGVAGPVLPGGRLEAVLVGLEQRPSARIVLAPAAHLLEDLADRADGFPLREDDGSISAVPGDDGAALAAAATIDRLRQLVAALPLDPIAGPYADADLAAIVRTTGELVPLAEAAAARGPERVQRVLGRTAGATAALHAPFDPLLLDLVAGDVVIVPGAAVDDTDAEAARTGAALRSARTPGGRAVAVLVADDDLTRLLEERRPPGGPMHVAHLVATLTAATHLEDPATAGRTLVVLAPRAWAPTPTLVAELIARLDEAPWLQLDAPATLARIGRSTDADVRLVGPEAAPLPADLGTGIIAARLELEALERALPSSAVTTADGRTRTVAGMRDELVLATSGWWSDAARSPAQALVDDVLTTSALGFSGVELGLGDVTLTARDGLVPVTLTRTRDSAIDVVVELAGPAALTWPSGPTSGVLRLEPGVETTVAIPTTTRSTGVFAVRVRVSDPERTREVASGTLSVRSTAVSGPALVVIAGLVVALLGGSAARAARRRT